VEIYLTDLIDRIIGNYDCYGDAEDDAKSLRNLNVAEALFIHLMESLADNAKRKNDHRASVARIGEKSYGILQDAKSIIEEVEDILYEEED